MLRVLPIVIVCGCIPAMFASPGLAQSVDRHLAGGEFAAAIEHAGQLPDADRDAVLAQVAIMQSGSGESTAAANTIRGIETAGTREDAIAGAGGGSFADFQSLIDLIQTTVVPDTWEALGGPSTMAPYPAGVFVDSQGIVKECEDFAKSDAVGQLRSLLAQPDSQPAAMDHPLAWRSPSPLRFVSLRRLRDELARCRIDAEPLPEEMVYLAGLSQVQYVFLQGDDVVIAGPVGGIDQQQGWYRDRASGLNTWRLDFLMTCLDAARARQPFGCTIDPTTEGLQRAAQVASGVQDDSIPIGRAASEMTSALGMQRVDVFGTAGDTPIGYLMVEADRHMKQLALGVHPMPRGVSNYLDVIEQNIARGPPSGLLLRLWFTAKPRGVRADQQRTVFELAGTPIRLSGQNERALASGQRGQVTDDFRTAAFVGEFNEHWNEIRSKYPVYGALESVYRAASVAELIHQHAESDQQRRLVDSLAVGASSLPRMQATPRQVSSIAKLHTVRHGRKRHHVLLASGGVAVDARQTLTTEVANYPSLDSVNKPAKTQPQLIQRWWWDAGPR